MQRKIAVPTMLPAILGSLFVSGCTHPEPVVPPPPAAVAAPAGEVVVGSAPPARLIEEATVAPGPSFVWVPGFWAWRGHWVWVRGRWAIPPHPGAVWVTPQYAARAGKFYYSHGFWR